MEDRDSLDSKGGADLAFPPTVTGEARKPPRDPWERPRSNRWVLAYGLFLVVFGAGLALFTDAGASGFRFLADYLR